MLEMMHREGILKDLVALKLSGSPPEERHRVIMISVQKLSDNFIRQYVAAKYVNMIARIIGLDTSKAHSST